MKKLCLLLTFVISLMTMVSCVPSNSPKGVAKQVLEALKNKDADKIVSLMGDNKGNALSPTAASNMEALIANKLSLNDKKNITSYEITNETLNDNGNKATVSFIANYSDGSEQDGEINLAKGEDGKWRMLVSPK